MLNSTVLILKSKSLLIVLGILFLNLIGTWFFFRADLTEDKRYSLSDAAKILVEQLESPIDVELYLAADDLPGGWERLKNATQETLDELKYYAGENLSYRFVNIDEIVDENQKAALLDTLFANGVRPTNIFDRSGGKKTENLVFPYARLSYEGKSEYVLLLKANGSLPPQEKLNQSTENVEYALATAIKNLTIKERKKVGLLTEFTKLKPINFSGLISSLQSYYDLYILDTKASESFAGLDAIILPKPDYKLDDSTKFKIDQFIMHGGKALFFVDGLKIDSIGLNGSFAQVNDLGLDDIFFKYGIKLNKDLVKDGLSSAKVPLVVGQVGDQPQIQPVPYPYFPLINNFGDSPITKNLDMLYTRFVSTIDTVNTPRIKKTALLKTSPYTKISLAPALVTYDIARIETDNKTYNDGEQTIAYLLEGSFTSLYKNQILPQDKRMEYFLAEGEPSKVLVVADGDIIVNDVDQRKNEPFELGFDRIDQHKYGNEDFLLNAMAYLIDEEGVIVAKNKEIKLRPLDEVKVREKRNQILLIGLVLPSLIVVLLGLVRGLLWKKKYN